MQLVNFRKLGQNHGEKYNDSIERIFTTLPLSSATAAGITFIQKSRWAETSFLYKYCLISYNKHAIFFHKFSKRIEMVIMKNEWWWKILKSDEANIKKNYWFSTIFNYC